MRIKTLMLGTAAAALLAGSAWADEVTKIGVLTDMSGT